MANFAPYQDIVPERVRALSPSPPTSPRPEQQRPQHGRQGSKSIGTAAVQSPTSPNFQRRESAGFPPSFGDGAADPWRAGERGDVEEAGIRSVEGRLAGGDDGGLRIGGGGGYGVGREDLDLFETRLGIRMDWEAMLAYIALPPAGGVLLLVLEHKSDYVRFHAWQSSLLFTFLFVIHVIFSWSSFISWVLFLVDLGLIGFLSLKAYVDAATLDRFEVPFFGPLASSILDDE